MNDQEMDNLLDLWGVFLAGALAMMTGEAWKVTPDRSMWDFLFDCRLGDYHRETHCFDFMDTPDIFPKLVLDAALIAHCAYIDKVIEKIDYSIQEKPFYREFVEKLHSP